MCFALAPAAAAGISAGVGAAQAGLGFMGQMQGYNAGKSFARASADSARQNFFNQSSLLNMRRVQERQRAFQEISQVQSEARRSQSLLAVSAGESGVSGISVADLMNDFEQNEANFITDVRLNQRWADAQLAQDQESLRSNAQSRINQAYSQIPRRPNFGNLLIGIAGAGLSAFNQFSVTDPNTGYRTLFPSTSGPSTTGLQIPSPFAGIPIN